MRISSALSVAAAALALLLAPSCGGGESGPPNVVIITMDTVRADHIGCYGYARPTSPRIDELAATCTRFPRAVATSSWTVPTHASLFTGRFPFEHGAHAFEVEPGTVNNVNPLPEEELTLAEVFWDRGYTTGAFVANEAFLATRWQLNQGFETYDVHRAYAPDINERAFRWLDAVHERPFFLFINYIDAHRPYNTTPRPGVTPRPAIRDNGALLDSLYARVMPGTGEVPAALAARVIDQYDTAISHIDDAVGAVLDRLKHLGVYDNTVVVVTSDHGEYFGEHHLVEHSKDIYQEGLMVPLVVKGPGQDAGDVDDRVVTLTDVPRMILGYFPDDWANVRSRFPDEPGNHAVMAELYYTRTKDLFDPRWGSRFDRIRRAYFEWPLKLIESSDGHHELYDLAADPTESDNRFDADSDTARRLEEALETFMASRERGEGRVEQPPLSKSERKKLKSLGY